jgi:hypothetical protein
MSLNPKTRTECVEVLMNPAELSGLDRICQSFGMARSTFLRGLSNSAVRTHGTAPSFSGESRGCRGPGRMASRASAVKGATYGRRTF